MTHDGPPYLTACICTSMVLASPLQLEKKGRNYLLLPSVFSSQDGGYHPWSFSSPNWNDLSWITLCFTLCLSCSLVLSVAFLHPGSKASLSMQGTQVWKRRCLLIFKEIIFLALLHCSHTSMSFKNSHLLRWLQNWRKIGSQEKGSQSPVM